MSKKLESPAKIREENCKTMELQQKNVDEPVFFGLTPKELYFKVGHCFDREFTVSAILVDMIGRLKEEDADKNILITHYLKALSILTECDEAAFVYGLFNEYFRSENYNIPICDNPSKGAIGVAQELHERFLKIIDKVNKFGFHDFVCDIIGCIIEMDDKRLCENLMIAFGFIVGIYTLCDRSRN
jgi:hypothetical protein